MLPVIVAVIISAILYGIALCGLVREMAGLKANYYEFHNKFVEERRSGWIINYSTEYCSGLSMFVETREQVDEVLADKNKLVQGLMRVTQWRQVGAWR